MGALLGLACLLLAALPGLAFAADEPATLSVYNREVFTFRAPILNYAPAERAAAARQRIEDAMGRGGPGDVTVKPFADGILVNVDGRTVFMVQPGDVETLGDETLETLAAAAQTRLSGALLAAHEGQGTGRRLRMLGIALAGALAWLAALWVLYRVNCRLGARVSALVGARAERLKVGGVVALQPVHFVAVVRRAVTLAAWAVAAALTYGWLTFLLECFPYTRPWGEQLEGGLIALAAHLGLAVVAAIPGLLTVIAIVVVTRALIRLLRAFFDRVEAGEIRLGWLDPEFVRPTRRIVNLALWLFALAMAYPYLPGSSTDAFKGVSVLVGLMLSIGASSIVGQAASGLILMYARAFRAGEFVRIGETEGTVAELGMFTTRIRTGLAEEVMLPNAYVLAQVSRNFSRTVAGPGFTLHTAVTIGYDVPWRQVHAMLLEAAGRTVGVLADPAPYVVQTALSDFYVEYRLVARAGAEAPRLRAEAMSALHANIQDVFNEFGVQIMSPNYRGDPAEPKIVPKARWYAAPAEKDAPPAGG